MRAVASLGVLTTHVAFQTGSTAAESGPWPVLGPVLGRLDLAVALFFALSGFLLWRPYVAAARVSDAPNSAVSDAPNGAVSDAPSPDVVRYARHRVVRIWPAYALVVVVVLALLPQARGASLEVWIANLTLTQVYAPLTLAQGLTQMWSLSVEVAFYALLPVIGAALLWARGRRAVLRIPILLAAAVLSLGWTGVVGLLDRPEAHSWVFGYLSWFVVGLVLAEVAHLRAAGGLTESSTVIRLGTHRPLMAAVFVVAYGAACTPIAGPVGLGEMTHGTYIVKMTLGAVAAAALLAPLVLSDGRFGFLESSVMTALGRWSYGIFIWHVAVLATVFGLFGIPMFSGSFVVVWMLTVAATVAVSAASYAFVEEPLRAALSRWEQRRRARRGSRESPGSRGSQGSRESRGSRPPNADATAAATAISAND
ncbi:acyltransferase family protein [Gordonia shandongensis]|uniref:acyltransferase family protein n=1 Tax=Gordonia shandongensis TaxID=376351 RepID=UPI00047BCA82|nr:acyltransferase [Gordonia shandongensis]